MTDRVAVRAWLAGLQEGLVEAIERADGARPLRRRPLGAPGGGGGESRVLKDGALIEQGGVNFSEVAGASLPASATHDRPALAGAPFTAMGVSLVLHPKNPHVPTTHLNLRFFDRGAGGRRARLVVRRRLRPDAVLSGARGRAALAPHGARRLRRHPRQLRAVQGLVRPLFLPAAPQRDARRRRALLRRPQRAVLRAPASRSRAPSARPSRRPGCRSRSGAGRRRSASASARSSCCGAAATSSSTWSTTAARCSGCRPAGAPNRS